MPMVSFENWSRFEVFMQSSKVGVRVCVCVCVSTYLKFFPTLFHLNTCFNLVKSKYSIDLVQVRIDDEFLKGRRDLD